MSEPKAGWQLNGLIAERVFGETLPRNPTWDTTGFIVRSRLPNYSTDMGAAWKVQEWIRERTDKFYLAWIKEHDIWVCVFGAPFKDHVTAPTPEHAICLAALELARREDS